MDLRFDFSAFERAARSMGGTIDQVPFALAGTLNDAVKVARPHLINDVWPRHVSVRNPRFLGWALRTEFATKRNLSVTVHDERAQGRGHLAMHAKGGTKQARGRIAIPTARIKAARSGRGVPKRLRPAAMKRAVVKGNMIFQPEGRGKNAKLRLAYVLKPSVRVPKDVPFIEEFGAAMRRGAHQAFRGRIRQAMSSRR